LCYPPPGTPLADLVAVACARWAVEECFAKAKTETRLDHYLARKWDAWYRHVTLSMLAHTFLAVTAAARRSARTAPAAGSYRALGQKGGSPPVDNHSHRCEHIPRRSS
jgi:hypothetical protein